MKTTRIVLKGQNYATPRTESVEIVNQGVLCASGVVTSAYSVSTQHFERKTL